MYTLESRQGEACENLSEACQCRLVFICVAAEIIGLCKQMHKSHEDEVIQDKYAHTNTYIYLYSIICYVMLKSNCCFCCKR